MLFNSLEFFIFFPIVMGFYLVCPDRYRWALLLAASYYFYAAWKMEYVLLLGLATLIAYMAALQMARTEHPVARLALLLVSIISNLAILLTFKYFNFFSDSLRAILAQANILYDSPLFDVLLPVGISFYTFQIISYTIDVYRGQIEPEQHLGYFALFVAFFPQLVAGPIERAAHMLPQFRQRFEFDMLRLNGGLQLVLWGLFKKVVIADRLGVYVDAVYNQPTTYTGWPILMATFFFAFQIYCDFSGYTDIALGLARMMGFDLMQNFKQPYFATSPVDFWRRWHISLSTWFRDYLYIPLGGNRVAVNRWYANLFIVFLISGLWHGANWTFVIWGGLHGLYVIVEVATEQIRVAWSRRLGLDRWPGLLVASSRLSTFGLIGLTWLFFRANSVGDALVLLVRTTLLSNPVEINTPWLMAVAHPAQQMALALGLIVLLLAVQLAQVRGWPWPVIHRYPVWLRWATYLLLALSILNLGVTSEVPFIYFQF
ncbi:MAG: MBOAT family protein [Anaerolineales bacterium]|nr:MBOAT family protein [Anaerolineales bacterium]